MWECWSSDVPSRELGHTPFGLELTVKRFLPFAVMMVAAACTDRAAPFAPTAESESVLMASRIAAANEGKVGVCHVDGKNNYRLISVNANAKPAHLAHGDILPGEGGLGADCSSVVVVESFSFGPISQVAGQLFWTSVGTPSTVSFLVQLFVPPTPGLPTPGGWSDLETVDGTVPGSYNTVGLYGNGTFQIVATLADGSVVTSPEFTF